MSPLGPWVVVPVVDDTGTLSSRESECLFHEAQPRRSQRGKGGTGGRHWGCSVGLEAEAWGMGSRSVNLAGVEDASEHFVFTVCSWAGRGMQPFPAQTEVWDVLESSQTQKQVHRKSVCFSLIKMCHSKGEWFPA